MPTTAKKKPAADGRLTIVDAPVAKLRLHPENPRRITPARLEDLKRALADDPGMLDARPLIALPDGTVIAGNQRLRAARALGWETIPTAYVDLDERTARLWMLRDNNPYGAWDEVALAEIIAGIGEIDLSLTGFDTADLDRLLAGAARDRTDKDYVPPPPVEPPLRRG